MTELEQRVEQLFQDRITANYRRVDRLFMWLMIGQWLFAIGIALWVSPYSWEGKQRSIHMHVQLAMSLGFVISGVPVLLAWLRPGWVITRNVVAIAQMLWSALLIHLTGGRIETHFHVFGSLAFVAFYRDWKVLIPATVVVAADHFLRQMFWPESVFGIATPEAWRFAEHAAWVVFEDVFLVISCVISVSEMRKIAMQNVQLEASQRVAREMEIAASIQTSMLPRDVSVPGLEVAARMLPAEDVGGDYYDLLPVPGGCWIAIGDVTGHGMRAGLTMLQTQAALAALVRREPHAAPAELWANLNATFFDTVRKRLRHDEHMTMSLLRYHEDGRFEVVGAHEEIVVWRAGTRRTEILPLTGTWIGVSETPFSKAQTFQLAPGDVLVLYTDGIIESRDSAGRELGVEAVQATVEKLHARSTLEIRDAIFELTKIDRRNDDASVVVLRYVGFAVSQVA
ncbi:MAG: PP2C family protein-serine/threonine phosphatase [Kofleriaceae bacterium]|nr:PP2C family protein-serine/threonine phosphatase [Kofleriaceae bacterium]